MNVFAHLVYEKCSLSLKSIWCFLKLLPCTKVLVQNSQLNGLTLLWIFLCFTRVPLSLNDFSQILHENGFSSEWMIMWFLRCSGLATHFPQMEQFSDWEVSCVLSWAFSFLEVVNNFPHRPKEQALSSVASSWQAIICFFKELLLEKHLSHKSHW